MSNLDILIGVIIIAYGLYNLYRAIKDFREHLKAKQEYLAKTKDFEYMQDYWKWMALYGALVVLAVYMGYSSYQSGDYLEAIAYIFILIFGFALCLMSIVSRQIWFDKDGFFYEKTYYHYKSVMEVRKSDSFFPKYEFVVHGSDPIRVSKSMKEKMEEKVGKYRSAKKNQGRNKKKDKHKNKEIEEA